MIATAYDFCQIDFILQPNELHQPASEKAKVETKKRLLLVGWMLVLYADLIFLYFRSSLVSCINF